MIFNRLLLNIGSGCAVDLLTIIDSTPNNSRHIGQMMIIDADGSVYNEFDESVLGKISDIVRTTEWVKPVTMLVENHSVSNIL